jgi:type II secretory pathway pseudopilin PulG
MINTHKFPLELGGFSLVELIISAAVGIVMIIAVLSLIGDFMQSQNSSEKVHDLLVASDSIINQIAQDSHHSTTVNIAVDTVSFDAITYTWIPIDPSDPIKLALHRNGVAVHAKDVFITNLNIANVGFADLSLPLLKVSLTVEHANKQGSRSTHETNTTISFRKS